MVKLRDHQQNIVDEVFKKWNEGVRNIAAVLPTGGGKTYIKAEIARIKRAEGEVVIVFAHRDVLLSQISFSLCDMMVPHSFIAARRAIRSITDQQVVKYGRSFYDDLSTVIVASVDSFSSKLKKGMLSGLLPSVGVWMMDETHHLLRGNKWGKCVESMCNAKGLGVTATLVRGDKKGLGRSYDGVFDAIVYGPTMGELIAKGLLSKYRILVPPKKVDTSGLIKGKGGDVNQKELALRTDVPAITGDVVNHYLDLANGSRAITFVVNIKHGEHVAEKFNDAGVPTEMVSSKTPLSEREGIISDFKEGRVLNLVNCDLFSEGFDVPSVETVIMLRFTKSYGLFKQQFGRMLRVIDGKSHGLLLDHVGNVAEHCIYGLPHDDPEWSLEGGSSDREREEPSRRGKVCPKCFSFYLPEGSLYLCDFCGHEESKKETSRSALLLQESSGKLVELEIDLENELLRKKKKIDAPLGDVEKRAASFPPIIKNSILKNHTLRQLAHDELRAEIQSWGAEYEKTNNVSPLVVKREFGILFGVSILQAHCLSSKAALTLAEKIRDERERLTL